MKKNLSWLRRSLLLLACFFLALPAPASAQLDILLTNASGFGEPGLEVLKTSLRAAGHTVIVGAPDGSASFSSASLDLVRPLVQVVCPQADECKVRSVCVEGITLPASCTTLESLGAATPAASALATISATGRIPEDFDLLISGINSGTTLGPRSVLSGTVGGAVTAIANNLGNIPAIAVSTEAAPVNATLDDVADFIVALLAHLENAREFPSDALLPEGVALNINYPDLLRADIAGVKNTIQGRVDWSATGGRLVTRAVPFPPLAAANVFIPTTVEVPDDTEPWRVEDTEAFAMGFITITAIDADFTAKAKTRRRTIALLKELCVDCGAMP